MFKQGTRSISDNDDFVDLLIVARESHELRDRLLSVLRSNDAAKQATLNAWMRSSVMKGAPNTFVEALSYFMQRDVAQAAIKWLSS